MVLEGVAALRFEDGARLYLAAPVVIQPVSSNEVRLLQGQVVGYCDRQARGFITRAGNTVVQDLGTEFGVSRERVRQIEKRLLGKLRTYLSAELGQAVIDVYEPS